MSQFRQLFLITSHNQLADIRRFIESSANQLGVDMEKTADMLVAANEATTNSFIHGFQEQACELEVIVDYEDSVLTVHIIDSAPAFDPTTLATPDTDAPLDDRKPGGLGVYMLHEFTDEVLYKRTSHQQNVLVLKIGEPTHD
ncbi:MAG: ATP-binding protein [Chloroflexota bacterium]